MNEESLSQQHRDMLHASAIADEVIRRRGYRTITSAEELRRLGFTAGQRRTPGLLLPLWTTDGAKGPAVFRPDNPRVVEDKSRPRDRDGLYPNRVIKYEFPAGAGIRLDCPPACQSRLGDPRLPLWVTEGQKKADALASLGLTAVALLGVWNFKGKNDLGGVTFLADWDYVALKGRMVRIVFDSDVMTKRPVQQALSRLSEHLERKGAEVEAVYLPPGANGEKLGVDDWLRLGHGMEELEGLVQTPRPAAKAAPVEFELLDNAPPTIKRPLALIEGQAYAATWLYVRKTIREAVDKRGEVIRYDPPIQKVDLELHVVCKDGKVYGPAGDEPLDKLPLRIELREPPPVEKLWSKAGVEAYYRGKRPNPKSVFERLRAVVNRFIDFDRSLAPQEVMAELIACYVLATWFLDGFNVIGFLWPNGDRGSGKTHLLLTVCEMAYLGQVILAGSSFASLRDLADYGATLAFDDAENISDTKGIDGDKRALLLAGNRRGTSVVVKEPINNRDWNNRTVNAYCARLFSAIQMPDPVLESRTILIPLIHSADPQRANVDPLDASVWPCDRRELIDDLWALGLAHVAGFPEIDRWIGDNTPLTGRTLQPWRAILAVANWLETYGVRGIWRRMTELALAYQIERKEMELPDLTALVIRALIECVKRSERKAGGWLAGFANQATHAIPAIPAIPANLANLNQGQVYRFYTAEITETALQLAQREESSLEPEAINARRVGMQMGKLRFKKDRPTPGGRQWIVEASVLGRLAGAYGISND